MAFRPNSLSYSPARALYFDAVLHRPSDHTGFERRHTARLISGRPRVIQAAAAGALVLSRVLFSGVIFAVLFRQSEKPEQALGYNAAGAMAGGLAESLSLLIGFKYLVAVAAVIYIASWVFQAPLKTVAHGLAQITN